MEAHPHGCMDMDIKGVLHLCTFIRILTVEFHVREKICLCTAKKQAQVHAFPAEPQEGVPAGANEQG